MEEGKPPEQSSEITQNQTTPPPVPPQPRPFLKFNRTILIGLISLLIIVACALVIFYFTRSNQSKSAIALENCDYRIYPGAGCKTGYKCFAGVDKVCGPGDDCSDAKQVGDNMCHRLCNSNLDCPIGLRCVHKTAYGGDVIMVDDKICEN